MANKKALLCGVAGLIYFFLVFWEPSCYLLWSGVSPKSRHCTAERLSPQSLEIIWQININKTLKLFCLKKDKTLNFVYSDEKLVILGQREN